MDNEPAFTEAEIQEQEEINATVEAFEQTTEPKSFEDKYKVEEKAQEIETPKANKLNKTVSIGKLAMALSKAQGEIQAAHKDAENPFFNSKYADLNACWDACREPLSKNGLAFIQMPAAGGKGSGAIEVTSILAHSSGEYIESTLAMPVDKVTAHGVGSAITYARRYQLCAFVGISPADDDGNAALPKPKR